MEDDAWIRLNILNHSFRIRKLTLPSSLLLDLSQPHLLDDVLSWYGLPGFLHLDKFSDNRGRLHSDLPPFLSSFSSSCQEVQSRASTLRKETALIMKYLDLLKFPGEIIEFSFELGDVLLTDFVHEKPFPEAIIVVDFLLVRFSLWRSHTEVLTNTRLSVCL